MKLIAPQITGYSTVNEYFVQANNKATKLRIIWRV